MYTRRKSTHTLGNGDTTQQPARDSEGELAAAAAAAAAAPAAAAAAAAAAAVLLLLLCCCCCAAAAAVLLLLLCCYCPAAASRPAMHRGAQTVTTDCCFSLCVFRNARRSE